jgi:hypothetical protein
MHLPPVLLQHLLPGGAMDYALRKGDDIRCLSTKEGEGDKVLMKLEEEIGESFLAVQRSIERQERKATRERNRKDNKKYLQQETKKLPL